jgi:hypothetical protein
LRHIRIVNRIELKSVLLPFVLWVGDTDDVIPIPQRRQLSVIVQGLARLGLGGARGTCAKNDIKITLRLEKWSYPCDDPNTHCDNSHIQRWLAIRAVFGDFWSNLAFQFPRSMDHKNANEEKRKKKV